VWAVFQEAEKLAGGTGSGGLSLAARELGSEAYELTKHIDNISANDISNKSKVVTRCIQELTSLEQRIEEYMKAAATSTEVGILLVRAQLANARMLVAQSKSMIDPPPLPLNPVPDLPAQQGPEEQPEGPIKLPPVEELTNSELADRTLKKSDDLIRHLDAELKRVRENLAEVKTNVDTLRQEAGAWKDKLLKDDFGLLKHAVQDADGQLVTADAQTQTGHDEFRQGTAKKNEEGEWEDHVKEVSNAVNTAMAALAMCERFTGQAEGGIVYIRRSIESIKSIKTRVESVDAELLAAVQAKVGLLPECTKVHATADEQEMIKHLMFTSDMPEDQMRALLQTGRDAGSTEKLIRKLMASKKLGTAEVTMMLARCHQLQVDALRYYGKAEEARGAMDSEDLKSKFDKICALAEQDVAKFTVPVIAEPKKDGNGQQQQHQQSVGVAVVGGGPIGLLAAVEARMAGASQVHVYEGRDDPYSRMNVLKIDEGPARRLFAAGVSDAVFPNGYNEKDTSGHIASVKTIEEALEARCGNLGIKLERGKFLKDVTRDTNNKVLLHFKGESEPKTCDLLIVATGGSVASAQKYADNVVLSEKLGIPFQKAAVKDYAAVGLFEKNTPKPDSKAPVKGWAYDFETHNVKYIVSQLTEEEFVAFGKDPRGLIDRLCQDAEATKLAKKPGDAHPVRQSSASPKSIVQADQLDTKVDTAWDKLLDDIGPNNFWGKDAVKDRQRIDKAKARAKESLNKKLAEKKQKSEEEKVSPLEVENAVIVFIQQELGVSRFPIEIQQAKQFTSKNHAGILVGDSAATPHPDTSKGFNTGAAEMGAVRDLVEDLRRGTGTEEDRKQAMQMYEWEVKRRTDFMVTEGLHALQVRGRERIKNLWGSDVAKLIHGLVHINTREELWRKVHEHLLSFSVDRDAAKDDRDWSRREEAVRKTRAFEASLIQAKAAIEQIIRDNTIKLTTAKNSGTVTIPEGGNLRSPDQLATDRQIRGDNFSKADMYKIASAPKSIKAGQTFTVTPATDIKDGTGFAVTADPAALLAPLNALLPGK
jgi:2-polyprenyl-6-methoxyphenol hydroxylase-like FAD-dependent oxidoreductase